MMLKSVERLLEFVGDMNATEINDHVKARPDGFTVSFRIDNEWLDGWNRAVLATVEKIEKEVSERFMELPLDADGVPVRVGDVMEWPTTGETFEVVSVGDGTLFYIGDGNELADWTGASTKRHHHEPTVEDVLREFYVLAVRGKEAHAEDVDEGVLAEYAQRLQLREVDG